MPVKSYPRGLAAKLPEAERPPVETLERFLNVSPELRSKFTVDLQNDCACSIELYDAGGNGFFETFYWDGGPRMLPSYEHRLALPIQPGILTDKIVNELIAFSGLTAEFFERYDMLNYGVITANLAGWGIFCFGVKTDSKTAAPLQS